MTLAEKGPNLASTLNQSAFNIGNAVGPFLGAAMLTRGYGFGSLPWLACLILAGAIVLGIMSMLLESGRNASLQQQKEG